MAIEFMNSYTNYTVKMEDIAVREAGAAGLRSLENLIGLLSTHSHRKPSYSIAAGDSSTVSTATDYIAVADIAVSKFKKFISLLDRTSTGHARFRRGPVSISNPPVTTQKPVSKTIIASAPILPNSIQTELGFSSSRVQKPVPSIPLVKSGSFERKDVSTTTINFAAAASAAAAAAASPATSFMSSLTGDTDSGFQITNLSQVSSAGQPNLSSSSFKRKCDSVDDSHTKCTNSSGRCHCSKKRKSRMKRVVRVPAISLKMSDIPPDDYSWRKYGQKPIKGSPHPRGYYKCSSLRGCPARKHVERALDDPSMLIVTYESEHNHSLDLKDLPATIIFESS